jgi:hypothetical protein
MSDVAGGDHSSRHHKVAVRGELGCFAFEGFARQLDAYLATERRRHLHCVGVHGLQRVQARVVCSKPARQQFAAIDLVRGRDLAQIVGKPVAADVQSHAHDHRSRPVGFGQQSGELAIVDDEVVRPLEPRARVRDHIDRGQARRQRHQMKPFDGQVGTQQHRNQQRGAGRCDPRPAQTPAPRALFVGHRDHTFGVTRGGALEQVAVRRIDRREPPNVVKPSAREPGIAPDGGRTRHDS